MALPSIVLSNSKFDGVDIERSRVLQPILTSNPTKTLIISDLTTLGCLPSILSFPEPAKRGQGSWKIGSFKGTDEDLLEIDRITRMQELHVIDIIRREVDVETARLKMLNPTMGMPPDHLQKKKLQDNFKREREIAQERLKCVLLDHEGFLEALYEDHNREFDKAYKAKKRKARNWLYKKVKFAQTSSDAESLGVGIEMLQYIFNKAADEIHENYMHRKIRPKHRRAKVALLNLANADHLLWHEIFRNRLINDGIMVSEVVFPRFREEQLFLNITVKICMEKNQLIVAAFDPDQYGGTSQQWILNVPMPRLISTFVDADQIESVTKGEYLSEWSVHRVMEAL